MQFHEVHGLGTPSGQIQINQVNASIKLNKPHCIPAELRVGKKSKGQIGKRAKPQASPSRDARNHHQAVEQYLIRNFSFKMHCLKLFLKPPFNRLPGLHQQGERYNQATIKSIKSSTIIKPKQIQE